MNITFKLFATLQDYLPAEARKTNAMSLELPEGTTVQQVIEQFKLPQRLCHLVLVDGAFIPPAERPTHVLAEGQALAVWPPVAGG